ncbi:MAG: Retinoblastoma-binding protein 5, variant 2 [Marteilia pararefringens]
MLAVGYTTGQVVIWDLMFRKVLETIDRNVYPIACLCWNHNTVYIASYDRMIVVYDVAALKELSSYVVRDVPVNLSINPVQDSFLIVTLACEDSIIIDTSCGVSTDLMPSSIASSFEATDSAKSVTSIAIFDKTGKYILKGMNNGRLSILDLGTMQELACVRVSNANIMKIECAKVSNDLILVISTDRVIRIFALSEIIKTFDNKLADHRQPVTLQPLASLQDQVNRVSWMHATFSDNDQYVISSSHKLDLLFIWDIMSASLLKTMSLFTRKKFVDIAWHPYRPLIYSVTSGIVAVWKQPESQKWSAFSPKYMHVDQNIVYREREDEFDQCSDDSRDSDQESCLYGSDEEEKEEFVSSFDFIKKPLLNGKDIPFIRR